MISHERLRELLSYNGHTGEFSWLKRSSPRSRDLTGCLAGAALGTGRRVIKIDGKLYYASRLAWFYVYGQWPDRDIDHKDRNPGNDKWLNLRSASDAQQTWNIAKRRSNTSGFIGVRQTTEGNWRADIRHQGRKEYLGVFKTKLEAAAAYNVRACELRKEFAVANIGADGGAHP